MDSAGAGAHDMGAERHIGEVCGLEGRGGEALPVSSPGVKGFRQLSHTPCFAIYLLQALQEPNNGTVVHFT